MKVKPFSIAVCGGSGSGKSTVVKELVKRCGQEKALVISCDHYYKDLSHMSQAERDVKNFDDPESLDLNLMWSQIRKLSCGEAVEQPRYDFASHTRSGTVKVDPRPVHIVDGIFSLVNEDIRDLFDLRIFIDVDDDIRLIRRLRRDMEERGRSMESVLDQYISTVRPMHQKFIAPCRKYADMVINWEIRSERSLRLIEAMIKNSLVSSSSELSL